MRPIWSIEMLGTLRAISDDATITRFRTRRVGLLLAFLAYHRDRSFSRAELADMLWPEFEAEQARMNLRQALASLRRHIEPPSVPKGAVLVTEQDRVSINSALVKTDTFRFVDAVETARQTGSQKLEWLKEAADHYKGDLLPGVYEDWVQTERLRLEDLFLTALQELIEVSEREGRLPEAIPQIHTALAKDRLREDLHFALMRAYVAAGTPDRALRHFNDWSALARDELDAPPSPELTAFANGLKNSWKPAATKGKTDTVKPSRPAPRVSREPTVRLPIQLTRFFGRADETRDVVERFVTGGERLVTLVGPAGAGKTRLSIEVGKTLADEHAWNVWFVQLADISDGSMILDAVLTAMRVRRDGQSTALEQLQATIGGSNNLVIFDNLEHIVDSAEPVIASVIGQVAGIACLATSRQALKLQGEQVIDLASLATPALSSVIQDSGKACSREELVLIAGSPSIQLFVDRARSVRPDFQLTTRNGNAVAAICAQLDGLPLAIEIAAGLSNAFTPAQLLANLGDRLEVLRSRYRDVSPRHRSLRAAIDYSYELLKPDLRRFIAELSVFRGGFTVDAAENVCLSSPAPANRKARTRSKECLRAVLELQERSLLRAEEAGPGCEARFRLLESFREFGREQLSQTEEEALRLRHAAYYYSKAEEFLAPRKRPSGNSDRDNWLVAMQTYRDRGELKQCVGLLVGLRSFSHIESEAVIDLAARPEIEELDPLSHIWLLALRARCHRFDLSFEESYRIGLRALEVATRYGQDDLLSMCYSELSDTASFLGRPEEALIHAEKLLDHGKRAGNLLAMEIGYVNIGTMHWSLGTLEPAKEAFQGALKVSTELHSGHPNWMVLYNLSRVHLDSGDLDDGLQFAGEGLRMAQRIEDEHGESMCISMIARYQLLKSNLVAALATSHEALSRRRRSGFLYWLFNGVQFHARILLAMGRYREGATLLASSRMVAKFHRKTDDQEFAESLAVARANLSDAEFERAWAAGLVMSLDEAVCFANEFQ